MLLEQTESVNRFHYGLLLDPTVIGRRLVVSCWLGGAPFFSPANRSF
jgi:hypothetical protein